MTNNEIAQKAHDIALSVSGTSMEHLPWTVAQAQAYAAANKAVQKLLREGEGA